MTDAAREGMKHFQKLTSEHLGTPFGAGYGDQGKFSLAEFVHGADNNAPAEIPVHYAAKALAESKGPAAEAFACLDYDGDGKPDLFLVGAGAGKSQLLKNVGGGKFEDVTAKAGLGAIGGGLGCAAGDFDNDGATDLAVCEADGVRLFRNEGNGKFADVTEKVGIAREKGCVSTTFVDYDHDGDLDLYVTMAPADGPKDKPESVRQNKMWRNNGNSTFTDVSAESGLGVDATGADVAITDFNNDRAIDFVVAGGCAGCGDLFESARRKIHGAAGD